MGARPKVVQQVVIGHFGVPLHLEIESKPAIQPLLPSASALPIPPFHIQNPAGVSARYVRDGARPLVILRPPRHACSHRIPLHLGDSSPKVAGDQHATVETVLPQMPGAPGARVEVLRITAMHAPDENTDGIIAWWDGDEMDMIAHQAIGQHSHFGVFQILAQQTKIGVAVFTGRKRFTAIHTTLGDVASPPGNRQRRCRGICLGCDQSGAGSQGKVLSAQNGNVEYWLDQRKWSNAR